MSKEAALELVSTGRETALLPPPEGASPEILSLARTLHLLSREAVETELEQTLIIDGFDPSRALGAMLSESFLPTDEVPALRKQGWLPRYADGQPLELGADAVVIRWTRGGWTLQAAMTRAETVVVAVSEQGLSGEVSDLAGGLPVELVELARPGLFDGVRRDGRIDGLLGDGSFLESWLLSELAGTRELDGGPLVGQASWSGHAVVLSAALTFDGMATPALHIADPLLVDPRQPAPYAAELSRLRAAAEDGYHEVTAASLVEAVLAELPPDPDDWERESFQQPIRFRARLTLLREGYDILAEMARAAAGEDNRTVRHGAWAAIESAVPDHLLLKQERRAARRALVEAMVAGGRDEDLELLGQLLARVDDPAVLKAALGPLAKQQPDEQLRPLLDDLVRVQLDSAVGFELSDREGPWLERPRPALLAVLLDHMPTGDERDVPRIAELLERSDSPCLRQAVARCLVRLGKASDAARPACLRALAALDPTGDPTLAGWVIEGLETLGDGEADGDLLRRLDDSAYQPVRWRLAEALDRRLSRRLPEPRFATLVPEVETAAEQKVQMLVDDRWHDVAGRQMCVLVGSIYQFRALQVAGASSPEWQGVGEGTGRTIEVSFDQEGRGDLEVGWEGYQTTVSIDTVSLTVHSIEYVSSGDATRYQIYKKSGQSLFMGWIRPGKINNPACFKQGGRTAVRIRFTPSGPLTFETNVFVRGDVHFSDEYITGGDYRETRVTLGPGAQTPTPGAVILSKNTVAAEVDYDHDVDISWQYHRIPGAAWYDAGDTDDLTYYITYDAPAYGLVNGAKGTFATRHFTAEHLKYATDLAENHDTSISAENIATQVLDDRGSISIGKHPGLRHDQVDAMWDNYKAGTGQCGCFAAGMAYVLRCLGVTSHVTYANLRLPLNHDSGVSGLARDPGLPGAFNMSYQGVRWGVGNNWQGAVYLTAQGATTLCYDAQHELKKRYWQLGNDEDGGATGDGVLYDYFWRSVFGGQQVAEGSDKAPSGLPLTILETPRYNGN